MKKMDKNFAIRSILAPLFLLEPGPRAVLFDIFQQNLLWGMENFDIL